MSVVHLSARTDSQLRGLIERGRYGSLDEAVAKAVDLLEADERRARLRAAVEEGLSDVARADVVEVTPGFWDEIEREAAAEDQLGLPIDPDVRP